jgi:predicted dinucleotide-binding enzyme
MTIGIIGAGSVGGTLGTGWAGKGHSVLFGVRDPSASSVKELLGRAGASAKAGSATDAAACDVVVLATPWDATQSAIQSAGDLKGKVLLDCTNPLLPDLSGMAIGTTTSGGEKVSEWAPGTRVVKVFNTTGFGNMANPIYGTDRNTMLYCGDDSSAKQTAAELAGDLGFDPVDAGPLTQARLLEPLALLWITLALKQGLGLNIAFKLMHR